MAPGWPGGLFSASMPIIEARGLVRVASDVAQKMGAAGNGSVDSWKPPRTGTFQVGSGGAEVLLVGCQVVVDPTLPPGSIDLRAALTTARAA